MSAESRSVAPKSRCGYQCGFWHRDVATLEFRAASHYLGQSSFPVLRRLHACGDDCEPELPAPAEIDSSLDAAVVQSPVRAASKTMACRRGGIRYTTGKELRYSVDLSTTFEKYFSSDLPQENRETLRQKVQKFTAVSGGSLVFREYHTVSDMRGFSVILGGIEAACNKAENAGTSSLLEELEDLARDDRVRGYALFMGQEAVAYLWCHASEGILSRVRLGWHPAHAALSPEIALQFVVLQRLFAEQSFHTFDFNHASDAQGALFATRRERFANVYFFPWSLRNALRVFAHYVLRTGNDWFGGSKQGSHANRETPSQVVSEAASGAQDVPDASVPGRPKRLSTKLALGSSLRTINLVGNALIGLLLTPLIVRSLGDRVYGLWALVGSIVGYYGLMDLGLTSAASRYLAQAIGRRDQSRCNRVFNTALFAYKIMALLAAAITILLAAGALLFVRESGIGPVFAMVILILGTSATIAIPLQAFTGSLNADLHFDITSGLELLTLALRAGLIVIVLSMHRGIISLAAATALATVPATLINVVMLRRKLSYLRISPEHVERGTLRELFAYGLVMSVSQVADAFRFGIDALVVSAYVGLSAVTHYNVANMLVHYFINANLAALGIFSSLFSQREGARDFAGIKRAFYFATKLSMWLASFIGFGLVAWGKAFITRWMGRSYTDAFPVLVVLTVGCIFSLGQMPSVKLLFATSKHRAYAVVNVCEAAANVVLSLILVRRYGMIGVALGTFFPIVLVKIFVQPVYFCRLCQIPYREYVLRLLRTAGSILAALLVPALLALRLLRPTYPSLVKIGLASTVVYVLAFLLCELFSSDRDLPLEAAWSALLRRMSPARG